MHMYLVVASALCVALLAAAGTAAVATGWVAPWGRRRVLRPKLWGWGSLVGAVGVGVFLFVGPEGGGPSVGVRGVVAWCGWGLFMVGLLVQFLAQRPGRTP
ncbi:hypothetical protein [Streptomyces sp. NPDC054794]